MIHAKGLTRTFGDLIAVNGIDLNVGSSQVYGFLGPNGSGKSTTIRMLLGLIRPTSGNINVFDKPLEPNRRQILARTGAMVEGPSIYGHLTGRENLDIVRRMKGIEKNKVDKVLALTRIEDAADRLARNYSLGMKQRLGLAMAMLGEPQLLILDEPTNGLDPGGIREIRELIKLLSRDSGTTVFLSSHLLSEVEQIADTVGIISKGNLLFEGSIYDLKSLQRMQVAVEVDKIAEAKRLLHNAGLETGPEENTLITVYVDRFEQSAEINRLLFERGIEVRQLIKVEASLERVFLDLTNNQVEGNAE